MKSNIFELPSLLETLTATHKYHNILMASTINWKRIQSTTWGFPSEITTSIASVVAAITSPAKPYPDPSSITLLDLENLRRIAEVQKLYNTEKSFRES